MSAGDFIVSKYLAGYGGGDNCHPIRIQPETRLANISGTPNSAPANALTSPISAVGRGRRSLGLTPRYVRLRFTGAVPVGYRTGSTVRIPCLTQSFYLACQLTGATGTYLESSVVVVSTSSEIVK
jgi:hypothetical protein